MDISVHIRPNAVAGLREGRTLGDETHELLKAAHELGIKFKPVFPVASTPEEAGQYFVQVEKSSDVNRIVEKLKQCAAVESAYHIPSADRP